MGRRTIKIGQKFGRLTIIEQIGKLQNKPHRTVYKCLCDCGIYKNIDAGNLRKPSTRSCGCFRRELAREKGKKQRTINSHLRFRYAEHKRQAKTRELETTLTAEDLFELTTKNCYYCNAEPKIRNRTKVGIEYPTNGIDRINSDIGYIKENCVPSCDICNIMKNTLTINEFYKHIKKILDWTEKG